MEKEHNILLNVDEFTFTIMLNNKDIVEKWIMYAENIICKFVRISRLENIFDGKLSEMSSEKLEGYDKCYNMGLKDYYFAMAYHTCRMDMGVCIKFSAKAWAIYQARYSKMYGVQIILPAFLQKLNGNIDSVTIRLTRIDFTVDYYNYGIDLNELHTRLQDKKILVQDDTDRCRIRKTSFVGEDGAIQTIYIGSRSKGSKGFLRIYDKKMEQIKNNGFRLEDAIKNNSWIRFEVVYKGMYAHSITEELLKENLTDQEFASFIAKAVTQKYRLYDIEEGEYRIETKKLIEIAEKSNAARLRCDSPRDNSLRQSIQYIIFSSGLFSLIYKIEQLFGIDGVDEFIDYLKSCYVSNIWKGATMTRELNLWVKKHEDLSKGKLEDNFEV